MEEVAAHHQAVTGSWQYQLHELALGKVGGFVVEVEPWDRIDDPEKAKLMLLDETRNIYTAIRYHLKNAAESTLGDSNAWREHFTFSRTVQDTDGKGRIRLFINHGNRPPPHFMKMLAGRPSHFGRKAKKGRSTFEGNAKSEGRGRPPPEGEGESPKEVVGASS